MNKILVLAKNHKTYFLQRLMNLVGEDRLQFLDPFNDPVVPENYRHILVRTSAIYGDDRDLKLLEKLQQQKIINGYRAFHLFRTKTSQYRYFQQSGWPHLPWLDLQAASLSELENFLCSFSEPWIIKPHRGQGGWGIQVMSSSELLTWYQRARDREYLLQPYEAQAPELRVFFIEDWLVCLRRLRQVGVAANFGQGGKAEVCDCPSEVEIMVAELRKELGLFYGALDLLEVDGKWIILEVNLMPGVEQLEQVLEQDVVKKFIDSLSLSY